MMEVEPCTRRATVMDTSDFWEDLKQKLDDELTQNEQKNVSYLINGTIKTICKEKCEVLSTRDLLTILENCMFFEDALSVLEHAFGYHDYHLEYKDKSFGQIISEYRLHRRKFGCSNIIGRDEKIGEAVETLLNTDIKGLWIYGMGGLGKTLLANEISARLDILKDISIFNFDLKQKRSIADVIKSILAKFEIYPTNTDTMTLISELICQLKSVTNDTCIVLDNIEDMYALDNEQLLHVLQRCFDGSLDMPIKWIITSRLEIDADIKISGISQMKLEPLEDSSADKLLRLSIRPIELGEEKRRRILEMTCRNPLAIRLVSSAMKSDWQNDKFDNLSFLNKRMQNGMEECIEYAYMSLTELERNQLNKLSVVETSQFDIDIVNAVLEFEDGKEAFPLMMKLTNQQIVQTISNEKYCLHPLICDYVRKVSGHEECLMQAQNNFCQHMITMIDPYIQQADKNYTKAIAKVSDNQPLLKILLSILSTHTDGSNKLFTPEVNNLLRYLHDMLPMTPSDKRKLYQNLTKKMLSTDRLQGYVFWKVEEIGMMLDDKLYDEAKKELLVLEKRLHVMSDDTNFNANIKARFWYIKGKYFRCKECKEYTKAIELFKTSYHIFEKMNNIPESSKALDALGNTYFIMKENDNALFYHQQAFDILNNFTSNDFHPDLSTYEFNIGTIYHQKANTEVSLSKCVTYTARENFEKALNIFEKSMAKDEKMKSHITLKYANKLEAKAKILFHLSNDAIKRNAAITKLNESLTLKLDYFTEPDKNRTLAFFKIGQTFYGWQKYALDDPAIARSLLKYAISYFRRAEEDISKNKCASLDETEKINFITLYKRFASNGFVSRDDAKRIQYFCQRYESGMLFDSSSSSSSDTFSSSETSFSDREDPESDKDDTASDVGISSAETEKQGVIEFEKDFFCRIREQTMSDKDMKKRRRSSEID